MDKNLLRPLFQKRYMEMNKPPGFRSGAAIEFQQLAMANQSKQPSNDQGIMTVTRPSGMQENVEVRERTPTQDVNITESIISGRENTKALAEEQEKTGIMSIESRPRISEEEITQKIIDDKKRIKESQTLGKQAQNNPSLFSDSEKKGIFAANLAIALAQPGDAMANLAKGLGQGAISVAKLNQAEREVLNEQKKLGKTDFYLDTLTGQTYKVEDRRAVDEFIQDPNTGQMMPRFVKPASEKKSDDNIIQKMVNGKPKDILRSDYADFLRGDYSKYPQGSIDRLPADRVPRMILKDSPFGKKGEIRYFDPEVANANLDVLGKDIPAEDRAAIEVNEVYARDRVKKVSDVLDKAITQGRKSNQAVYLIKDIRERLDFGAKGGFLNSLAQGVQQFKSGAGFFLGTDESGNEIRTNLDDLGGDGKLYDPNKGENFRDVELAFTNPEAYIESKTANREMTEKEASKFRKSMKFLSPKFAKLAAGLRTNVIQLAYAIAKANEEGGRFSVSDIQFAMDSIGSGLDEGIFKSKLNTVAQRLTAQSYNQFQQFFITSVFSKLSI